MKIDTLHIQYQPTVRMKAPTDTADDTTANISEDTANNSEENNSENEALVVRENEELVKMLHGAIIKG